LHFLHIEANQIENNTDLRTFDDINISRLRRGTTTDICITILELASGIKDKFKFAPINLIVSVAADWLRSITLSPPRSVYGFNIKYAFLFSLFSSIVSS